MLSEKGDPVLAHWQYGLGRAVAFTSDAKPKWARMWMNWEKYRQFWSQTAQWSLRRVENADFTTDVNIDKGEGVLSVEALDEQGNLQELSESADCRRQPQRRSPDGASRANRARAL